MKRVAEEIAVQSTALAEEFLLTTAELSYLQDRRMNEAEKKAAALPPKLTVPMILFFLPVLIGVILGPAIIQVMDNFG